MHFHFYLRQKLLFKMLIGNLEKKMNCDSNTFGKYRHPSLWDTQFIFTMDLSIFIAKIFFSFQVVFTNCFDQWFFKECHTTIHLSEWPKCQTLITNGGENAEWIEPSFITGGSIKWYSHIERQFDSFLQN